MFIKSLKVLSGWGRHVNPRPFHFNVWQNSLQKKKKVDLMKIKTQEKVDNNLHKLKWHWIKGLNKMTGFGQFSDTLH